MRELYLKPHISRAWGGSYRICTAIRSIHSWFLCLGVPVLCLGVTVFCVWGFLFLCLGVPVFVFGGSCFCVWGLLFLCLGVTVFVLWGLLFLLLYSRLVLLCVCVGVQEICPGASSVRETRLLVSAGRLLGLARPSWEAPQEPTSSGQRFHRRSQSAQSTQSMWILYYTYTVLGVSDGKLKKKNFFKL